MRRCVLQHESQNALRGHRLPPQRHNRVAALLRARSPSLRAISMSPWHPGVWSIVKMVQRTCGAYLGTRMK
ncbi:hypothetical protein BD626DRAFT_219018 [Schizophyllum amplum]|uniref:Uncharacterized protein n=1 Tax=Schizophyllum amplum TaxID=97359 RepID=A0A550CKX3_9AGAR|nr:hypothetical protein BD626DRAFT_219018 [Auriculariopsis ampla]